MLLGYTVTASQSPATIHPGSAGQVLIAVSITNNDALMSHNLNSLRLTNTSTGLGPQANLDAELGTCRLYRDNGNGSFDAGDVLLKQSTAAAGAVLFSGLSQSLPPGSAVPLLVVTDIPLAARDGDALDLAIQSSSDVTFDASGVLSSTFPLAPAGSFPVDGMVAAQIGVGASGSGNILAGTSNALALNVLIPANGYQADQLQQLAIDNSGTALPGSDITALRAWVDDGNGLFDPAHDRLLGPMAYTGARWQLTGLAEALPVSGLRLFFSIDVGDQATEGRTIHLGLPPLPDPGVSVASANDGPIDRRAESPLERVVSTANRVTLSAASVPSATVRPGDPAVLLLHVRAANSYSTTQTLDHLTVTNAGIGGTILERDRELQSLTLRLDGNGDGVLGTTIEDPPIGSAFFVDGEATFANLGLGIATGSVRELFVTGAVSLTGATDGDTLSTRIQSALDVGFADTTRVVASWPLDSRARAAVDGMVAAQVAMGGTSSASLAPGDSEQVALDLTIPRNGRLNDTLQGLAIVNLGSAADTNFAGIRLWRDGGDAVFSGGAGDDQDLGPLAWTGTAWQSAPLSEVLSPAGARLFAVVRISATARDSATVRLAVPVGGITVASGNDGPLDQPLATNAMRVISNSPLLASLQISPSTSTIGQSLAVSMVVRNLGSETIQNVAPSVLAASGSGSITLASGPTPPSVNLVPGASDTLRWSYVASGAGSVQLSGDAQGTGSPSGAPHTSLVASSNPHEVFAAAESLAATIATVLPGTVARGQAGLALFDVQLTGGGPGSAPIRVRGLRIGLESDVGTPLAPTRLFARADVHHGAASLVSTTTFDSTVSVVALTFASPLVLGSGESADLLVGCDLLPSTSVTAFRAVILDSTWIASEDANTSASVPVRLSSGAFPVRTRIAQIVEAAQELDVTALPGTARHAESGQSGIPLLGIRLVSPGTGGITSDVRVSALAIDASDTLGATLPMLASVLSQIGVRTAVQSLASRAIVASDGARIVLQLNPPLSVPVNTPVDVFFDGTIAATALPGAFRLRLADSTRFDASDANTRDRVAPLFASDPLPGSTVFIEAAAETLLVRGLARFPAGARAGDTTVVALDVVLHHPGASGTAPILLDSLVVASRSETRQPLVPSTYLGRVRVLWDGGIAGTQNNPPASGNTTAVALGAHALLPGDSATVELIVDLAAIAPEGFLELALAGDGVRAVDAYTGARVAIVPDPGELPLVSGLVRIQAPARVLVVGLHDEMPEVLARDGREVQVATVTLTNPAAPGAGAIVIDHLTLRAADSGMQPIALGAGVRQLRALADGQAWAQSGSLTSDSTTALLASSTALQIAPGASSTVEIRLTLQSGPASGSLRVGLDQAGVGVVQPASALLQVQVQPVAGQAFTLWTQAGGFSPLDLRASYSNFPNPFAAGRDRTTFAYYLAQPSRVWLRILTLEGESVATLIDGVARSAGIQQADRWDGRNGAGRVVRNGVYVAELTVRDDGGRTDRVLRKVAVVR
jgi:hypothetical protein